MTPTKTNHRSLVSMKLPKPVPELISFAQSVVTAMTGNPSFGSPLPPLSIISAAVATLQTTETATLARTKGAVVKRDEARVALIAQLEQLRSYVQSVADANIENGASIITSAGLGVRKTPVRAPRTFNAKPGVVSGTAKLVAASAGHRASYEWESSTDGGKTWVLAPVTLQAKTTIAGLPAGTTVQFRYRAVTKAGEGDWSQTLVLLVR